MRPKDRPRAYRATYALRTLLEERGIDLVAMQLEVYRKAMESFDSMRGYGEKGDAGVGYLQVCNQAVGTLAKYAFPTMTAIKVESLNDDMNHKVIDAVQVRQTILSDPFAKSAANLAVKPQEATGIPVLVGGKKDE